jgi:tetratricopeptide (TPR) repeat protein
MFYCKELELAEACADKKGIARAYNNVGTVYAKQGKIDKALESFTRSLEMKEEIGDLKGKISTYDNMALVFDMLKSWKKAEECYDLSLEIKTRLNDVVGMAETLWRKAKLYEGQQRYQEALDFMAQTISLLEQIKHPQAEHYRSLFNEKLRAVYTE